MPKRSSLHSKETRPRLTDSPSSEASFATSACRQNYLTTSLSFTVAARPRCEKGLFAATKGLLPATSQLPGLLHFEERSSHLTGLAPQHLEQSFPRSVRTAAKTEVLSLSVHDSTSPSQSGLLGQLYFHMSPNSGD